MSLTTVATIVIPTRNRADLAQNAIMSVLNQPDCEVDVVVSDNSTQPTEVEMLAEFCSRLNDPRLRYVRPPQPLPMSEHWDWALQQAFDSGASHFAVLSDRMMFKPGHLRTLLNIVEQYPDRILCYLHDKVSDHAPPYLVYQHEWTGKVYEVASTRLLTLSAQGVIYDNTLPRLLNCLVPRTVLVSIKKRFGSFCGSIAPDWSFCYRALDAVDSLLYFNKAALVHYAISRSNGISVERGVINSAFTRFVKDLATPLNISAPFPEIITVWNAIISEYCTVKNETGSSKFPEIDLDKYLAALAANITRMEDSDFTREQEKKLRARGWTPEITRVWGDSITRKILSPRRVWNKARSVFGGREIPICKTAEQALEHALHRPRRRSSAVPWDEALHQGLELPVRVNFRK